jgi:hypothetical protein
MAMKYLTAGIIAICVVLIGPCSGETTPPQRAQPLNVESTEKALEGPTSVPKPIPTPTTVKTVETIVAPESALCPEWWNLAVSVGWDPADLPTLDRVMWRESRCDPKATNGHDNGLTQINQIHREFVAVMGWDWETDMFKPKPNLAFALKLWQGSGWRPWGL